MLVLEVEWLTGVCRAAHDPANETPDWPPQPDRIFSALTASWGAHGEDEAGRAALEWLESLPPPRCEAVEGRPRNTAIAYVPVNDTSGTNIHVLPERRIRQARQFPAVVLVQDTMTHLRLVWDAGSPDVDMRQALDELAKDTSYIGHSSSVVRCRFLYDTAESSELVQYPVSAAPYKGRLAELGLLYARHMKGDERARPRPNPVADQDRPDAGTNKIGYGYFGTDWVVLRDSGGQLPDLRATPYVARVLRDALMSLYGDPVPEWLSGHTADGKPSPEPHLAIVPMANAGFSWSDGRLMGMALVLPLKLEEAWAKSSPQSFMERQKWLSAVQKLKHLKLGKLGIWELEHAVGDVPQSLKPTRYIRAGKGARLWQTVTPIALDRHLKTFGVDRLEEAAEIIKASAAYAGLPIPKVRAHKHSAITGAPSAWPPGGAPKWTGWARPAFLVGRQLFHATITFEKPVAGPVLLGAGRFLGLGLCLPVVERS